jgi:hypothetical protein
MLRVDIQTMQTSSGMNNRTVAIFLVIWYLLGNLAVYAEGPVKQVDGTPEQSVTEATISI